MVVVAVKKWPPKEEVSPQFPVRECESCGFFLEDYPAKATEKGFDSGGGLIYTDHCPRCGRGYAVWTASAEAAPAPDPKPMMPMTAENSLTEYQMEGEAATVSQRPAPMKGGYYCAKCLKNHMEKSNVGKVHLKHREG
jgi:hypothetical protein